MYWNGGQFGCFSRSLIDPPPAKSYPSNAYQQQAQAGAAGWLMDSTGERLRRKQCGEKDGCGIYSGAEGPGAEGPINWLLPVCQSKQSLITQAVVFMLPAASALHHLVAFALCNDQSAPFLSWSCCCCTTTPSPPLCCHPSFFSLLLLSFLSSKMRWAILLPLHFNILPLQTFPFIISGSLLFPCSSL